ncbi:AAA family ATPase [Photobacterium angustum]|uniref:AAA family ATPase n=1 Tax=Photobacterium angustum TaxID=661 RepID=UPI0005DB90F1|nr:AAA family ATPase [Photobacterium angustum]KJG01293.1 cell division protein DamX [Photobacterium angustum]KJG17160.1 cell division protein DamX [Photobacterium angustum]KJG23442.1 cell division protein DamX [Photobacterium angustum]KJG30409.1 cell division protein DamX [Photobacterium angustum]PSV66445.1 cell division protein DamX [Photobacterium angustum]
MRSTLEAKNLDLDSQIQLLSRVQFITRFSSHLILLNGTQGSGKTWLAHQYLENYAQHAEQALLTCTDDQTQLQQRTLLLQQFHPTPMFNEQDSLSQSAEHLLPEKINFVIIIDNAHFLAPELLAELWALVRQTEMHSGWQINVLLFADPNAITQSFDDIVRSIGPALLELEISELSPNEISQFSEMLLNDEQLGSQHRRDIKSRLARVEPRPGALQQLPQPDVTDMSKGSRRLPPTQLLIGLIVIVCIIIAGWFGFKALQETKAIEAQPIVADPIKNTDIVIDEKPLPTEINSEGLTVGRAENEAQRVVVPSPLIDAIIDEQRVGGTGKSVAQEFAKEVLFVPVQNEPVISGDVATQTHQQVVSGNTAIPKGETNLTAQSASGRNIVSDDSRPLPAVVKVKKPEAKSSATAMIVKSDNKSRPLKKEIVTQSPIKLANTAPILAINKRHYAIQLSASMSWNETKVFVEKNKIQSSARIYKTRRDGKIWFIVISGDYTTVTRARSAIKALPKQLKALSPWPKSYRKIQQEIER